MSICPRARFAQGWQAQGDATPPRVAATAPAPCPAQDCLARRWQCQAGAVQPFECLARSGTTGAWGRVGPGSGPRALRRLRWLTRRHCRARRAAQLPAPGPERSALMRALVDSEAVARLEPNAVMATGLPANAPVTIQSIDTAPIVAASVQSPVPSWGLDRIDGRIDNAYGYTSTGAGVCAYITDTGVQSGLPNFGDRLLPGTFVSFPTDNPGQGTNDVVGHGTHTVRARPRHSLCAAHGKSLICSRCHHWRAGGHGWQQRVRRGQAGVHRPRARPGQHRLRCAS